VIDRAELQRRLEEIRWLLSELESRAHELLRTIEGAAATARRPWEDTAVMTVDGRGEPEYVSVRELANRIPYAEQTIRNLMTRGIFRLGEHYIKPRSRVIFRWSKVREWLDQQPRGT
jgi:hypothetical protein